MTAVSISSPANMTAVFIRCFFCAAASFSAFLDLYSVSLSPSCTNSIRLNKEPAMGLLYEDPMLFVHALSSLITNNKNTLGPLFEGRQGLMPDIVEDHLMHRYTDQTISKEMYIKIRFCVGGAMRILSDKDGESLTDDVVFLIQKVMN